MLNLFLIEKSEGLFLQITKILNIHIVRIAVYTISKAIRNVDAVLDSVAHACDTSKALLGVSLFQGWPGLPCGLKASATL